MSQPTMSGADWDWISAIDRHEFAEPATRLLHRILRHTRVHGDPPRRMAVIPRQSFLALLCKLSKGRTSGWLTWLEEQRVIERSFVEVTVQGQKKRWMCYALNPPAQWTVSWRVKDSPEVFDSEAWLDSLSIAQPDMFPPPPTLRDLLREDFVERQCGASRVDPGVADNSQPEASSSPAGNQIESRARVGRLWAAVEQTLRAERVSVPADPVPPGGTFGSKVPSQGTATVPSGGTRARVESNIRSRITPVQSNRIIDRAEQVRIQSARSVASSDVAARLFRLIGENERNGLCRRRWAEAIDQIPDELNELIGHVEMLQREGRLSSPPVRWLNTAVGKALAVGRPV